VDNKYAGKGTLTFPNGEKYEGGFINGEASGEGTFIKNNGTKCTGLFQDGKPVGDLNCTVRIGR